MATHEGEFYVEWTHADACPAGVVGVMDERWPKRRQLCTCGMPSNWEMGVVNEHVGEMWRKRVENGEIDG